jgi:UDP-glucose 4-epimerase
MKILVTGGAGYLGSVVVGQLLKHGHEAVVYDNLSRGRRAAVAPAAVFIHADLRERDKLINALEQHQIEAVIHLAAHNLVGESVAQPREYYDNNVGGGLMLLDALLTVGVKRLVFSSTCAIYGAPEILPIEEDAPPKPINPYGETVLALEKAVRWYEEAYGLRSVVLRCFNVAGASAAHGEAHRPETHLIPQVLRVAAGQAPHVDICGEDYPTPDGTCIRDYVHVLDLAEAHLLALKALEQSAEPAGRIYNLGYGSGYSVAEVVEMARQVTRRWIATEAAPRRAGDPAMLIANADKIMLELGWQPRHSELDCIIESAWRWHLAHPKGYSVPQ